MARTYIPTSIPECTPAWLTGALRAGGVIETARVTGVDCEMLGEGEGFMGSTARLRLEYDRAEPGAPSSLIAKLPTLSRKLRAEGELLGIFEREVFFYSEFADTLPNPAPRCLYAEMDPNPADPELQVRSRDMVDRAPRWLIRLLMGLARLLVRMSRRRYVLLLEDMAPARVGDQVGGASHSQLVAVLRHLAHMHAHFWASPDIATRYWIPILNSSSRALLVIYQRALKPFESLYGRQSTPQLRRIQDWLNTRAVELVHVYQQSPHTLIHGDFRLDNLFFRDGRPQPGAETSSDVVLFDWQVPICGPGAYDLAYFLSSTLEPDVPRSEEEALVRLYHEELVRRGVDGYSLSSLQRDYDLGLLLMVQRMTSALPTIETTNERGRALFEGWIDRLNARIEHIDPDTLLPPRALPQAAAAP
jgi:hypothetical protein